MDKERKFLDDATLDELRKRIFDLEREGAVAYVRKGLPDIREILLANDAAVDRLREFKKGEIAVIMKHIPDCLEEIIQAAKSDLEKKQRGSRRRKPATEAAPETDLAEDDETVESDTAGEERDVPVDESFEDAYDDPSDGDMQDMDETDFAAEDAADSDEEW